MTSKKPVVVIGDGWAALGTVGFLVSIGIQVRWIAGTGARILAPLGGLEWGPGVEFLIDLAEKLGVECGEPKHGIFVREFRNKAFRLPPWSQAPNLETRLEVRDEILWSPEQRFVGTLEARFNRTFGEIEEEIRSRLVSENFSHLRKMEAIPVVGFKSESGSLKAVILGSGEEILCETAFYADRWSALHGMEGLPKPLGFLRNREAVGVLQSSFFHEPALPTGIMESFYTVLNPSEQLRDHRSHIWGHVSSDGKRSIWTLCVGAAEGEDNHEIAKKFRRIKTSLDKVFAATELVSAGAPETTVVIRGRFSATIQEEHLRFEEDAVFATGVALAEAAVLPELQGLSFLTDGYGPACSFLQVGSVLRRYSDPQSKGVDLPNTDPS